MNTYPRETVEFGPITVTVDGTEVLTGIEVCVALNGTRPNVWVAPTTLAGKIGVMIDGMTPGLYSIWARITSSPEIPVIDCGLFKVT